MKCVVFVPGIMGSRLEKDGVRVWPPSALEVVFGYDRIEELLDPALEATAIIPKVSLVSVYASILEDIRRCGYLENDAERRFIPFPYDWRQSNVLSAERLAAVLDTHFSSPSVDLDITILAHSMGGLVSRYLLESGKFDDRPWFNAIRKLVTLGTPHHGAPLALKRLSGSESMLGVSGAGVRRMGNDSRYPSLYQLIGTDGSSFFIRRAPRGELPTLIDPFDPAIRDALDMNPGNVDSARQFWRELNTGSQPAHTRYLCLAGAAFKTTVRSEVRDNAGTTVAIERKDGGDGTVPLPSALLDATPLIYSRKKHMSIFEDRDFREQLFDILDAPAGATPQSAASAVAMGTPSAIGISVSKETYATGEPIELSVSYSIAKSSPDEFFQIRRFDPQNEQPDATATPVDVAARFDGTDIVGFSIGIDNDLEPGLYQLVPRSEVDDPTEVFFFVRQHVDQP